MTTIKTTCPACGDVMLGIEALRLLLTPNEHEAEYTFECPLCAVHRTRSAGPRVIMVLLAAGVSYDIVGHERITEEDVAAFVAALELEPDPVRLLGR